MFTLNQIKEELTKRYNQDINLEMLEKCIHIWHIDPVKGDEEENVFFDESSLFKLYRGIKLQKEGYSDFVIPQILSKTTYKQTKNNNEAKISPKEHTQRKIEEKIQQLAKEQKTTDGTNVEYTKIETNKPAIEKKLVNQTNPAKVKNKPSNINKVVEISSAKTTSEIKENHSTEETETPAKNNDKIITKLSDYVSEKVSSNLLNYLKDNAFLDRLINLSTLKRDNEILSKQVDELLKANAELEEKVFELELETQSYKKIWKNIYFRLN